MPGWRALGAVSCAALLLAGCGGGSGGGVMSTPVPTPTPTPTPSPTPTPTINYDTAEYRRSNGAVAAQAIAAYQAGATGAGVLVGVIDSGVASTNSEFAGRISPLSRDVAGSRGIEDEDGHGTEVAGILLAARNNAGVHGVAFDATLLALRADRPGSCAETAGCSFSSTDIAAGLDVAAAARARVVNLSLGGGSAPFSVRSAAARASANGAVIVLSAGNEGNPEVDGFATGIHAAAPGSVIVAGAIDEARTIASFSNRAGVAANYFLTALGNRVRSFDQTGTPFLYSGTSEAAPIISGAAALLAQAFPGLSPIQIVDILLRTADDLGDIGTDAVYGRGALNIARAFSPIGTLSIAKVADPIDLGSTGVLGSPLGDAPQLGLAVSQLPVRDHYDRAYTIDLGSRLYAQAPGRLAATLLGADIASNGGRYGVADIAVSVRGVDGPHWRGDVATGVDPRSQRQAAFLGGQMRVPLAPGRVAVFGYGQSATALLDSAGDGGRGAMPLVATRAREAGLAMATAGGAGLVQQIGGWTIGTAFAAQSLAQPQAGRPIPRASRALVQADRWLGPLRLGLGAELLVEDGSVLGSQLPMVFGVAGASTTSALARFAWPLGQWTVMGDARIGLTRADLTGRGLIISDPRLVSTAASLSISRDGVFADSDQLRLTMAQPLRAAGEAMLATDATPIRLGPSGRETAIEMDYLRSVGVGSLALAAFWRQQPGNIATSPADAGVAARLHWRF